MGFKDIQLLLIDALQSKRFQHEYRSDMESRNLLAVGKVKPEFVVTLLQRCRGCEYQCTALHSDARTLCHVFTPSLDGDRWYIKAYFLATDAMFISVHR